MTAAEAEDLEQRNVLCRTQKKQEKQEKQENAPGTKGRGTDSLRLRVRVEQAGQDADGTVGGCVALHTLRYSCFLRPVSWF